MKGKEHFLLKILGGCWLLLIFGTYLFHHPYITQALGAFDYWGVLLFSLASSFLFYGIATKFSFGKSVKLGWSPWQLIPLLGAIGLFTYYQILSKTLPSESPISEFTLHFAGLSAQHLLFLGLFVLAGFSIGSLMIHRLLGIDRPEHHFLIATGLGWSLMGLLVFFESLIHPVGWIFVPVIAVLCLVFEIRSVLGLVKMLFSRRESKWNWTFVPLVAFISMLLSFAWIAGHKLYAVGYDGVTLYGNLAQSFGAEGVIIKGFQPYNWSMMMGLGMRWFNSEAMMFLIGYLPGFLLVPLIYRLARKFVQPSASLSVVAVWLGIPAVMYHYGSTEKIDLAISFFILTGIAYFFSFLHQKMKKITSLDSRLKYNSPLLIRWLILGVLMGFAMGVKLTTFFVLFAFAGVIFYQAGGYALLKWGFLVLLGIFFGFGLYQVSGMIYGTVFTRSFGFLMLAVGFYQLRKLWPEQKRLFVNIFLLLFTLGLGTFLGFGPWPLKNFIESTDRNAITLIQGETQAPVLDLDVALEEEERLSAQAKMAGLIFMGSSRREEMGKFLGFDEGFYKYFTVLFKMSTNPNNRNKIFVDISFYFLFILPFFLFFSREREGYLKRFVPGFVFVFLYMVLSTFIVWNQPGLPSIEDPSSILKDHPTVWSSVLGVFPHLVNKILYWIGSLFDYVPLLGRNSFRFLNILLGILFLILIKKWTTPYTNQLDGKSRTMIVIAVLYTFMWYMTGTGIGWYAFPIIPVLIVASHQYFSRKEAYWRYLHIVVVGLFILCMVPLRFSNVVSGAADKNDQIVLNSSLLYSSGFMKDKSVILNATNPAYAQVANILNNDRHAKIYLSGTLMSYFIDRDHKRVHQDHQLSEFSALQDLDPDDDDFFIEVLKKNGYKYILFNPSDINYDKTPEQSHKKKFEKFWNLMRTSNQLQLRSTNHQVIGSRGETVTGIKGTAHKYGTVALMEIK